MPWSEFTVCTQWAVRLPVIDFSPSPAGCCRVIKNDIFRRYSCKLRRACFCSRYLYLHYKSFHCEVSARLTVISRRQWTFCHPRRQKGVIATPLLFDLQHGLKTAKRKWTYLLAIRMRWYPILTSWVYCRFKRKAKIAFKKSPNRVFANEMPPFQLESRSKTRTVPMVKESVSVNTRPATDLYLKPKIKDEYKVIKVIDLDDPRI